jgi:peroxiredoxin
LPSVNRLYQDYKAKGLEVVLISFRESPEVVKRAVKERGYVAPVLVDQSGDVAGVKYGVWGPPTVYFVNRDGALLARGAGPRDWASPAARRLLDSLLAAP